MTFTIIFDFLPPCLHLELSYCMKFKQPPLRCLLFCDQAPPPGPPPPWSANIIYEFPLLLSKGGGDLSNLVFLCC